MVTPDTAVLSPRPRHGPSHPRGGDRAGDRRAPSKEEKDFDAWKGKLAGKIILYGDAPRINPDPQPLMEHYDEKKLVQIYQYPLDGDMQEQHVFSEGPKYWEDTFKKIRFQEQVARFFADEHASAILVHGWSGDGGIMRDDNGEQWVNSLTCPIINSLFRPL